MFIDGYEGDARENTPKWVSVILVINIFEWVRDTVSCHLITRNGTFTDVLKMSIKE